MSAEAEGVGNGDADVGLAGFVGDVVEVALGVWRVVVDRRRQHALVDRERAEGRFDGAGGAEAVPGRALRRGGRRLCALSSPSARLITRDSLASPSGVEVPCALM
jgi:hypothetical protein